MAESGNPPTDLPGEIAQMSFEDALAALEAIVKRLESGDGSLDESITAYERGALLKRHCEAKLREAEAKVERISLGADGSIRSEPADLD
jgi:exodeoxyribonuclease VII small subunit